MAIENEAGNGVALCKKQRERQGSLAAGIAHATWRGKQADEALPSCRLAVIQQDQQQLERWSSEVCRFIRDFRHLEGAQADFSRRLFRQAQLVVQAAELSGGYMVILADESAQVPVSPRYRPYAALCTP